MAFQLFVRSFLLAMILCVQTVSGRQKCYACTGVSDLRVCNSLQLCGENQQCYTRRYTTQGGIPKYDTGCMSQQTCKVASISNGLIGRRDLVDCFKCCNGTTARGDICNSELCNPTPLSSGMKRCYSCNDAASPEDCYTVKTCYTSEKCSAHEFHQSSTGRTRYTLGCDFDRMCGVFDTLPDYQTTPGEFCLLCCNGSLCNSELCKRHQLPALPVFAIKPHDRTVYVGDIVSLHCKTTSTSQATLRWTFKPVNGLTTTHIRHAHYGPHNEYLQMTVDTASSGVYTCIATNGAGSANTKATVIVHSLSG